MIDILDHLADGISSFVFYNSTGLVVVVVVVSDLPKKKALEEAMTTRRMRNFILKRLDVFCCLVTMTMFSDNRCQYIYPHAGTGIHTTLNKSWKL